jgi:hypothetical protein
LSGHVVTAHRLARIQILSDLTTHKNDVSRDDYLA